MADGLIINADDFGRSVEINRAVLRAHREGVLNSASLMVAGEAADEAVEIARQNPGLAVGLHLVVVDGPAVLPPARIPHLVEADGKFPNAPVKLGLRYAFNRAARKELAAEIATQFERFAATGLPLSHVDGHQHMHMHPAVFDRMLPWAKRFGAKRIRIVHDDLRLALRYDRHGAIGKSIGTAIFAALARRATGCGLPAPKRTYGFLQSGQMTEPYVLLAIAQMPDSTEIYFHPTDGPRLDELGPNPGDLATLVDPAVRQAIEARALLRNSSASGVAARAGELGRDASSFNVTDRHVARVAAK
ncbi:MAG TPA: hopanoid biosynthesis-associated protein HpnK [Tepidisphaeraceae bacterium]|jgi:hopanoid biosynthesis associated protein HpnK